VTEAYIKNAMDHHQSTTTNLLFRLVVLESARRAAADLWADLPPRSPLFADVAADARAGGR
jgi:hypothetical protein